MKNTPEHQLAQKIIHEAKNKACPSATTPC